MASVTIMVECDDEVDVADLLFYLFGPEDERDKLGDFIAAREFIVAREG